MKSSFVPVFTLLAALLLPLQPARAQQTAPSGDSALAKHLQALRQAAKQKPASVPANGQAQASAQFEKAQDEMADQDGAVAGPVGMARGGFAMQLNEDASGFAQLGNVESYVQQSQYDQAIRIARRFARRSGSPEMKKLWAALLADLLKEQEQRDKEVVDRAQALLKKIADTALAAKDPAELAALTDDVTDVMESDFSNGGNSPVTRRLRNQMSNAQNFLEVWSQYLENLAAEQTTEALRNLENLRSSSSQYRSIVRLFPTGSLEERRAALRKVVADQARQVLARVAEAIPKTASREDYRKALAILDDNRQLTSDSDLLGQALYNELYQGRQGLQAWLAMLDAEADGKLDIAAGSLNSYLSNSYTGRAVVSREAVEAARMRLARAFLDRRDATPSADLAIKEITDRLEKARSPEDITVIMAAVSAMRSTLFRNDTNPIYNLNNSLKSLRAAWTALNEGRFQDVWEQYPNNSYSSSDVAWQPAVEAFRQRLFVRAVAGESKLPELDETAPGKSPEAVIQAAAEEAYKKADWPRVLELLQAGRIVRKGGTGSSGCGCGGGAAHEQAEDPEMGGIRDYLAGQNLEGAGQFVEAARAYQRVVWRLARRVPRGEATARLAALTREHPEVGAALNR